MDNYFDSELRRMEQELLALKSAQEKFAGVVPTISKAIDFSVSLSLNSSRTSATGSAIFRVTLNRSAIIVPTLDHYYDDVTKHGLTPNETRYMLPTLGRLSENVFLVTVECSGTQAGSQSDVQTLINGGSVSLSNKLTVVATDDFTMEVI